MTIPETLRTLLQGRAIPARVESRRGRVVVTVPPGMLALARMLVHAWGYGSEATVSPEPGGYRREALG